MTAILKLLVIVVGVGASAWMLIEVHLNYLKTCFSRGYQLGRKHGIQEARFTAWKTNYENYSSNLRD